MNLPIFPKHMKGYIAMCEKDPTQSMCINHLVTGKTISNYELDMIVNTLADNFTPMEDDVQYNGEYWHYNESVNEPLSGDCEDVSMTFIAHALNLGVSADKVQLVISNNDKGEAHAHARIGDYDFYDIEGYKDTVILTMDDVSEFKRVR